MMQVFYGDLLVFQARTFKIDQSVNRDFQIRNVVMAPDHARGGLDRAVRTLFNCFENKAMLKVQTVEKKKTEI